MTKISIFRKGLDKPVVLTDADNISDKDMNSLITNIFSHSDKVKRISINGGKEVLFLKGNHIPDMILIKTDKEEILIDALDDVISGKDKELDLIEEIELNKELDEILKTTTEEPKKEEKKEEIVIKKEEKPTATVEEKPEDQHFRLPPLEKISLTKK